MELKEVISKVSGEMRIPEEVVKAAYRSQWEFIKNHIEQLPLKEIHSKEEFEKLRTNFNVPSLGKLCCTYDKFCSVNRGMEFLKNLKKDVQDKED